MRASLGVLLVAALAPWHVPDALGGGRARAATPCGYPPGVSVRGASGEAFADVCAGAGDALAFFLPFALERWPALLIETGGGTAVGGEGATAAGSYGRETRRVRVLPQDDFLAFGTFLGLPPDRALHRAVAAHEITHAVLDAQFPDGPPSGRAFEYVAAVVTLATMDGVHRERILADVPVAGYADESEISLIYYLMSPVRFTVKAYRHYLRDDAGPGFVAAVLAGDALRAPAAW